MGGQRVWKIRHSLDRELSFDQIEKLKSETGLSQVTIELCLARGLDTVESIRNFFSPSLKDLTDPLKIKDMDQAVQRVAQAKLKNEKIRVFGDYDVDGTTGAALLGWVFRELGFEFDIRQPDRFKDGYGLNVNAVSDAARSGVSVLVTVDCGITSFEAASLAKELGLDLIIIDHHQISPVKGLPEALAVVDPQRKDCESGLKQLCGCGLAFYFSVALRQKARELGWFKDQNEINLKQHLDLVVIATAADMVPLTGDNRILVKKGLEVLKSTKKPGLRALLQASGLNSSQVSPGHLGFVLGPRINASGRMESASIALSLLMNENVSEAAEQAQTLERLNAERMEIQNQIWDQVQAKIEEAIKQGKHQSAVVVGDESWHEGVIGIVASRVTEIYKKPAVVISFGEDFGKASVRSVGKVDILKSLQDSSEYLRTFGGHPFAAGLTLLPENLEAFENSFEASVQDQIDELQKKEGLHHPLWIEGYAELESFDLKTLRELEAMAPFGPGNPEPVYAVKAKVESKRILKERHLKLNLSPVGSLNPKMVEAIWFHGVDHSIDIDSLDENSDFEWAGVPEINRFRGQSKPNFRIKDLKKH